ncbi:hypothetical protein D9M68_507160 [compost metagenome]
MAHHQEADGVHAEAAGVFDVLFRYVRLGAVGGYPHASRAGVIGSFQVMHGADAGQQQHGEAGVLDDVGGGFDPLQIGVGAEAVVEAGTLQTVAVGDFDGVHPCLVQGAGDGAHVIQLVLVADGVAAIAQGHVGDVELLAVHAASPWFIACAIRSAVASAAEVMMSRLPA